MYTKKLFLMSFILFSFFSQVFAQTNFDIYVKNYSFPFHKTFQASLAIALYRPNDVSAIDLREFTMHPERDNLELTGERNHVNVSWLPGTNKNSPVIFIIPGLGGNAITPSALYVAEMFYKKGYGVFTLPSSMNWQFALAVSSTGLPGNPIQDAKDMLKLMKKVFRDIQNEEQIKPQQIYLLGFSLGAINAAYVVNENLKENYFKFKKVLMLNPPYQNAQATNILDQLLLPGKNYSEEYKQRLLSYAFGTVADFLEKPFSKEALIQRISENHLTEDQLSWLAGMSFRDSLKELVIISQEIHDLGILKTPINKWWRYEHTQEAAKFNFSDYQHLFLEKYYDGNNAERILLPRSPIDEVLQNWDASHIKWAIFHNANDFLWQPPLGIFLETHSKHSRVYPLGGHLGNLWMTQNQNDILDFFKN